MSKIILLNGCGSSGKTSIVKALQHQSRHLWLSFGIGTFIDMIPCAKQDLYLKFNPSSNERGPTIRTSSQPEAQKLFEVMPKFARMLATTGNNLIIDEVLLSENCLRNYVKYLNNYTVYSIGIFCAFDVMQKREILRGDRCIGLANDQLDRVHKGILNSYDITVDTTNHSSKIAAEQILKFTENNPNPKSFKNLYNLQ